MKHLFIINSHTTFLTSMGVVEYLKLNENDVYFLYVRNYNNSIISVDYHVVKASFLMQFESQLFQTKIKRFKALKKIDDFILKNINDKFHLYCPHLENAVWQAFYTNSFCIDMSYIQEGGIPYSRAYITKMSIKEKLKFTLSNKIYRLTKRVWHGGWYTEGTMKKQKEIHSYAINYSFFHYLPSINHIVKWPSVKLNITIPKFSHVFIFDGFVSNGVIEPEIYDKYCKKIILENIGQKNFVKFHPAQTHDEIKTITQIFEENHCSYEILPNAIPFELFLSAYSDFIIYGFSSSLLYFAVDLGFKVVSKYTWLFESHKFRKYVYQTGHTSIEEYKQKY